MSPHLSVTFDNFAARLTEFIDQRTIDRYFSECLALYCQGFSVQKVASTIEELSRKHDSQ